MVQRVRTVHSLIGTIIWEVQVLHSQVTSRIISEYCKSTNFGMLLYLADCVFSLIFGAPTYVNYVDRTVHRRGDAKFNSCQTTLF